MIAEIVGSGCRSATGVSGRRKVASNLADRMAAMSCVVWLAFADDKALPEVLNRVCQKGRSLVKDVCCVRIQERVYGQKTVEIFTGIERVVVSENAAINKLVIDIKDGFLITETHLVAARNKFLSLLGNREPEDFWPCAGKVSLFGDFSSFGRDPAVFAGLKKLFVQRGAKEVEFLDLSEVLVS